MRDIRKGGTSTSKGSPKLMKRVSFPVNTKSLDVICFLTANIYKLFKLFLSVMPIMGKLAEIVKTGNNDK
jgi:hypothetical protein